LFPPLRDALVISSFAEGLIWELTGLTGNSHLIPT
jgi:hypothetical protein